MALQVWLPLNNNIDNYGLTNAYVPPSNLSTYTDGFFGKSLSCNGSTFWAISAFTLGNEATIAHWSKTSTNGKMAWVLECSVSKYLNLFESTIYTLNTGDSNNNPFKTPNNEDISVLHDNKWHHFAVTWGDSVAKLYIDGEYKGTALTFKSPAMSGKRIKLAGGFNDTHSYDWNGQICDFRIYDNCLTPEDVKRLYDCALMDIVATNKNGGFFYDKSGLLINSFTETNVQYNGNSMSFNGSTSIIKSKENGLPISGGTLSLWFYPKVKPSGNGTIMFIDGKSRMAAGIYNNGTQLIVSSKTSSPMFPAGEIIYNSLNHLCVTYGSDCVATMCFLNGVKLTGGSTNNWSLDDNLLRIGARELYSSYFNGDIHEVLVYRNQLTESEIIDIYNHGCISQILPDEYERLEYIQSNGTQDIDTLVGGFDGGDWEIYCEWMSVAAPPQNYGYIFGVYRDENTNSYRLIHKLTSTTEYYVSAKSKAGGGSVLVSDIALNEKHKITIKNNSFEIDGVSYTAATTGAALPNSLTMHLFKSSNGNAYSKCRIYLTYAKKNGVFKYYIFPSRRKSDSVVGMYDIVSNSFLTNSGTGSFTAGPAV